MIAANLHPSIEVLKRNRGGRPRKKALDLNQYNHIRRHQAALLVAHMLLDGVELSAIQFMIKMYSLFLNQTYASGKDMAKACGISPQAAVVHIRRLTNAGYLNRDHYRAWSISDSYLTQLNKM